MTRKLLLTSDLHLTSNASEAYRHRTLKDATTSFIEKHKPDALVILGDLTEEKDRHSSVLVNIIVNHLHRFAHVIPTFVMMGNHDYHNEGHPFFAFINRIPGLHWIDKVTDGHELGKAFEDIVFLPHTRNHQRDWANIRWKDFTKAFAHNTFTGAETSHGHQLEGIPLSAIPKHVDIIAGDVHVPQSFGGLTYIGAPYSVDFGDYYKPRMMLLDGDKLETLSTANYPQKVLLTINDINDNDETKDHMRAIMKGDVVKARVKVDSLKDWHTTHRVVREFITSIGAHPFKVEPVVRHAKIKRRHEVARADNSVQSEKDVLRAFAKRHDVQPYDLSEGLDIIDHGENMVAGLKK